MFPRDPNAQRAAVLYISVFLRNGFVLATFSSHVGSVSSDILFVVIVVLSCFAPFHMREFSLISADPYLPPTQRRVQKLTATLKFMCLGKASG